MGMGCVGRARVERMGIHKLEAVPRPHASADASIPRDLGAIVWSASLGWILRFSRPTPTPDPASLKGGGEVRNGTRW